MFKKRRSYGIINLLNKSNFNFIFFLKSANLELRYLSVLKKLLKKIRHRTSKGIRRRTTRLFLSIAKNYSYTKKSKNARMGKGKGRPSRLVVRVAKFRPFIYFSGHYNVSLRKVASNFSKKTRVLLKQSDLNNDRLLFGLGRGNHPYSTYVPTKLR